MMLLVSLWQGITPVKGFQGKIITISQYSVNSECTYHHIALQPSFHLLPYMEWHKALRGEAGYVGGLTVALKKSST